MKKLFLASLFLSGVTAYSASAQSDASGRPPVGTTISGSVLESIPLSPVHALKDKASWEFGPIVQGGKGVTDQRDDFKFISAGVHLGKVLTPELLTKHVWRGNFEYAGELYPFWRSYTPKFDRVKCVPAPAPVAFTCSGPYTVGGTFSGITLTPIILRWNFTSGHRIMPWIQGAGGILWTNHKYPAYPAANSALNLRNYGPDANASVWNFTPQGGVGMHIFVKPKQSVDFSANAVHISSASLGDRNPGVNASVQFTAGYTWWK